MISEYVPAGDIGKQSQAVLSPLRTPVFLKEPNL